MLILLYIVYARPEERYRLGFVAIVRQRGPTALPVRQISKLPHGESFAKPIGICGAQGATRGDQI